MEKCRICFSNRKRMHSLYDSIAEGITFAELVTLIANVKVLINDGLPNKACLGCCNRLKDIYDFKCQIERSDIELQKTFHVNRISFTDIKDIKCKLDIRETSKNSVKNHDITENFVKSSEKLLEYKNTVIQRLESADSFNKKTLSVKEFLESIKEDPQNKFDIIYDVAVDYAPEYDAADDRCEVDDFSAISDVDYTPIKIKKKKKKKLTNTIIPGKSDTKIIIKPVYLSDIRMVRTKLSCKKRKTKKCKQDVRADMCPQCGKMVKSLRPHMLLHSGVKNFKCKKCSKCFYIQAALKIHEMTHGDKVYKCDQCVAVFHRPASLRAHQMMHSDDKKYSCETCGKAFKRRGHLLRHSRGVHMAQKNIICDLCPRSFQNKTNLNHHMRVHTGERPYKCEICSQPYSYKHDFNRHCLKKHGVFLKGRNVCNLNEETLIQERIVMRDMVLRINGIIKDDKPINPFQGPHAVKAFELALKALEAKQIDVEV